MAVSFNPQGTTQPGSQTPSTSVDTHALVEVGSEKKGGKMRLRLLTDAGSVSIAYKEIGKRKPTAFESRFYKLVTVSSGGTTRNVLLNVGSLKKHFGMRRSDIKPAEQKSMQIFLKHQTFVSRAVAQGLTRDDANRLAKTIDEHFESWQQGGQDVKLKKGTSGHNRTIKYIHETGEVHVRIEKLGKGGFGKVTKTIKFHTGEVFAHKKVLEKSGMSAKEIAERKAELRGEGERVKIFAGCPNVIQVHSVGAHGAMFELMNRGTLADSMNTLTPEQRISVTRQAVYCLGQVHGKGMVHRDIKLENLLVHEDEHGNLTVKVADFGLAKKTTEPDHGSSGTSGFFSPDRLASRLGQIPDKKCDPKDDNFAMGLALHKMHQGNSHPLFERIKNIEKLIDSMEKEQAKGPAHFGMGLEYRNKAEAELAALRKEIAALPEPKQKNSIDHLIWGLLTGMDDAKALAAADNLQMDQAEARSYTLNQALNELGL